MVHEFAQAQVAAAAINSGIRDLMQYIGNAAAVGAFVFAWRTNTRVTRLETVMTEPDIGIVSTISPLKKGALVEHGTRLDQHDSEIARLDRDKEPRRAMQPTDVGVLDRRTR
ncbi:MAG TPA: hypothetical protein VGM50_23030 [Gemmatimonadaceae bacterium]|jgi:hypothetical protein